LDELAQLGAIADVSITNSGLEGGHELLKMHWLTFKGRELYSGHFQMINHCGEFLRVLIF
jgi:hypothetical protein